MCRDGVARHVPVEAPGHTGRVPAGGGAGAAQAGGDVRDDQAQQETGTAPASGSLPGLAGSDRGGRHLRDGESSEAGGSLPGL